MWAVPPWNTAPVRMPEAASCRTAASVARTAASPSYSRGSSRSVEEMRGRITEEYPGAEINADLIEMDLSVPFDAGTSSGTMTAEIRSVDQCIEGTVRCYVNQDASGEPAVELPFSHYLNEA